MLRLFNKQLILVTKRKKESVELKNPHVLQVTHPFHLRIACFFQGLCAIYRNVMFLTETVIFASSFNLQINSTVGFLCSQLFGEADEGPAPPNKILKNPL
jgi:hypothetical protein